MERPSTVLLQSIGRKMVGGETLEADAQTESVQSSASPGDKGL